MSRSASAKLSQSADYLSIHIPGRADIVLPEYYKEFESYYPNCELMTRYWFTQIAGGPLFTWKADDWVYIDCGAHIGYYSILFSQLSPQGKVWAIEPTSTADMLETNLAYNNCRNVQIERIALGATSGRRVEKVYRLWADPLVPDEMEYDFTTLDEFVDAKGIDKLDLLKIDVDSFDFDVLQGAEKTLARFDPWLIVELNIGLQLRGYSRAMVVQWLYQRGYDSCVVLDGENCVFKRAMPPIVTVPYCYALGITAGDVNGHRQNQV